MQGKIGMETVQTISHGGVVATLGRKGQGIPKAAGSGKQSHNNSYLRAGADLNQKLGKQVVNPATQQLKQGGFSRP